MTGKIVSKILGAALSVAVCCSFMNINASAASANTSATQGSLETSANEASSASSSESTTSKISLRNKTLSVSESERPNLPLIQISTKDGELPTYEVVTSSEGYAGETITNNEYVKGNMTVSGSGVLSGQYEMKFKIRGNTSAVESEKKPYKIKLSEKADLLGRGDSYADKTWILLSTGTSLNTYIGDFIAQKVKMEWTPSMAFVNVEINGDWQGLYILTEAVQEGSNRVNISNSGYLFENDAYWWNEDYYFKTKAQAPYLGYTFKYPDITSFSDSRLTSIKSVMQKAENYINSGSSSLWSVCDKDTWARWLLARDILGQGDPSGSNMYFYKNSSSSSDLVKMGPLWDFDSAFMHVSDWSEQHEVSYLPYYKLVENETFVNAYIGAWSEISGTLQTDISTCLDNLQKSQGAALNASRQLDKKRWGSAYVPIETEIKNDKAFFNTHLAWMNTKISSGDLKSTENVADADSTKSSSATDSSASTGLSK
ncbi:MAG: CotH kinase family protein [Butyrivibrio sp.]|nr:CotH kinase family protein [Butyrivibrio sp.]